jgi:dihydroflavonol-4-reductase
MTIISVTGGTSFIGRHLVTSLLEQGNKVRILTRQLAILRQLWPKGNIEPWPGDLTLPDTLRGFTDSAQVIYHLGGEIRNVNSFNSVNVDGTQALLKICRGKNLEKFVHLSSVGVIGASGAGSVNESTPCHPKNEYERSKLAGEQIVLTAFKKYQVPVTVLRPTIVFGEGSNKDHDSFAQWLYAIQRGWFRFIGTGDAVANYVYVEDVVNACLLAAKKKATGEVYIVSDSCSLRDFVGAASEFLGVRMPGHLPTWLAYILAGGFEIAGKVARFSPPLTVSRAKALTNSVVYSNDKLRKQLGFSPIVGWREGLHRTITWYRQNKLLPFTKPS